MIIRRGQGGAGQWAGSEQKHQGAGQSGPASGQNDHNSPKKNPERLFLLCTAHQLRIRKSIYIITVHYPAPAGRMK
tara:strand:- start:2437 stop:2664 length:228 start_codon:yes stop_codon:yes gene_type:complete